MDNNNNEICPFCGQHVPFLIVLDQFESTQTKYALNGEAYTAIEVNEECVIYQCPICEIVWADCEPILLPHTLN